MHYNRNSHEKPTARMLLRLPLGAALYPLLINSLPQDIAQTATQRTELTVSVGGLSRVAVALEVLIIIDTQCVRASSRQKSLDHL